MVYKATLGKKGYNLSNEGNTKIETTAKFDYELYNWLEEAGFNVLNMLCYNQLILVDLK